MTIISDRVNILGINIDNVTMSETIARIENLIGAKEFSYVVTPNVDHLIKLQRDSAFREIYASASLVVPDGVPLLWASRILGTPLEERVSGADLFLRICEIAASKGYSIFLLGGNSGIAQKASFILKKRYQGLIVSGYYCPEFGFENDITECARIQQTIAASKADILFVGLGAPKQERWIAQYGPKCNVRVAIGIGVSFSFVTGDLKRAPRWMQKRGLEWLWRLLSEPRRLCRRYVIDDIPFVWLVAKSWLKQRGIRGHRRESIRCHHDGS